MLLKAGLVLLAFALAFAAVVAFFAFNDEPMERAVAAKASPSLGQLVRFYPPVKPRVERAEAQPEPMSSARVLASKAAWKERFMW